MKKSKDIETFEDFEDFDDFLEENGPEMLVAMSAIVKGQQEVALGLTKLVLEHTKQEKVTKETVFQVFNDAMKIVAEQLDKGVQA